LQNHLNLMANDGHKAPAPTDSNERSTTMSSGVTQQTVEAIETQAAVQSTAKKSSPPRFVSSLVSIAGGQLGCVILAALTEVCYARWLGPAPRGLISLCLMSIAFGSLIGSLGSEATIIVWSSRAKENPSKWFPAVMFWVVSGCLLASVGWSCLYWKWQPSFLKGLTPGLAILVLVSIPFTVFFSILMSLLIGEERFPLRSFLAVLNRVASLLAFFLCVFVWGRTAESAVVANLAGIFVGACVAVACLKHFFRNGWKVNEARRNLVPTLFFGMRGQAGNLASFFSYRLDVFVVNYFLDTSQVGLYALGVMVSEAVWQVPGIVSVALCPRTARTVGAGAELFTRLILRQVFFVTLLAGLAIAVVSPLAIPLVFGARFAPSVSVIWWILPGTIALSLSKVICSDLTGRGLNVHTAVSSYISLVCTLGLDWVLIPRMGIHGAALASSLAYLLGTAYLLIVIQRELRSPLSSLFIPSKEDFLVYRRAWTSFRTRFWPENAATRLPGD
jgi:O-antigen/teichoic acid export membrane protein